MDKTLIERFVSVVGQRHGLVNEAEKAPYLTEWRQKYQGETELVLLPGTVEEVARLVSIAAETGTPLVPQGGNTGLVGGQLPRPGGGEIVISLKRLTQLRQLDAAGDSMVVEAGMTLGAVQAHAREAGRLFPLSIASEGSAQIGGVVATNAGGIAVLKYGMMRDLVLGLEVVVPSGEIWQGLSPLRKDNTGYDLKSVFVGSEGTLGIVTAATLKLFPVPYERQAAFLGLQSLEAMAGFFNHALSLAGGRLSAFEVLSARGLSFALNFLENRGKPSHSPLKGDHAWYGLIEVEGAVEGEARAVLEGVLAGALEKGLIEDGVVTSSEAQRLDLWQIREVLSEAQTPEGGSIKHDVSVPVARIPAFIDEADALVERLVPGARPVPFGHFGDGNIHYNISQPMGMDKAVFLAEWERVSAAVYDLVLKHGGSISAEHGIGVMKRDLLGRVKDPAALSLMRAIKAALDPKGIMNPGKVL